MASLIHLQCEVDFFHTVTNNSKIPSWSSWSAQTDKEQQSETHGYRAVTDAAVSLYSNLSLFRQQLQTGNQIHGVIYEAGSRLIQLDEDLSQKSQNSDILTGDLMATKLYTKSKSHYYLRAPTVGRMSTLKKVFENAVIAAASSSGKFIILVLSVVVSVDLSLSPELLRLFLVHDFPLHAYQLKTN